ncbi:unnamed protein product [Didymodactylos carnosus]|uniref:Uncharacterized protein n=1 Tax=Didymodactylos carnosus TaxID=1234261 RepID=A0A815KQX1_9BILA|nr:unnamed protein product [Didymodactylos carnosus]CAF1400135.1 unnamed protein product [Didymodactylos carnosus]CAF4207533.1 unnamed protein product [Didymodactylos carnosus]CAF4292948.1 unnamed protein product [Didymodactylos carnosus]
MNIVPSEIVEEKYFEQRQVRYNTELRLPYIWWQTYGRTVAGDKKRRHDRDDERPAGICIDQNENEDTTIFYVIDNGVRKYVEGDQQGEIILDSARRDEENERGQSQTNFSYITMDREDGVLFVSDTGKNQIQLLSLKSNNTNTIPQSIQLDYCPMGIFLSKEGDYLYVSDFDGGRILRYDRAHKNVAEKGKVVAGGNGKGSNLNQLHGPMQIYVDYEESIYIADSLNHRIMKWVKNGLEGEVVAGGNGRGYDENQLNTPNSVFVDRDGTIFITDTQNDRIVRWSKGGKSGSVIEGAGVWGSQPIQVSCPTDLAFDSNGSLYVSEGDHSRVQMFYAD